MVTSVGVDLGKRKSQYAVLDAEGNVQTEVKLPNIPEVVRKFLRGLPGPIQIGCETCVNTYWLVELAESIGVPIFAGHAYKLKLIAESRIKTDKLDARVIAQLLRIGFFPSIAIPPKDVRRLRELLRGRVKMTRSAATMVNRLHGVLTRAGVDYRRSDVSGAGAEAWLDGVELAPEARFMALTWRQTALDLYRRVKSIDEEINRRINHVEPWKPIIDRLATIPGVGRFSAMLILMEIWDVVRFANSKKLASYVGLVPSVHQTGQTLRGGPLTKQGNRYVRWILVQDAWVSIRHDWRYKGMHEHYAKRLGRAQAIIPVARQILADAYEIWRDDITYEELLRRKTKRRIPA